jgi:hypothetical protein
LATEVYTVEEVTLQDDETVELRPLVISRLRKFMKLMDEFAEAKTEDESFEVLLKASALCVSNKAPQYWDSKEKTYTEAWEEAADMPTIYKILDVCGGVKLNDPNLLAAAAAALGQN